MRQVPWFGIGPPQNIGFYSNGRGILFYWACGLFPLYIFNFVYQWCSVLAITHNGYFSVITATLQSLTYLWNAMSVCQKYSTYSNSSLLILPEGQHVCIYNVYFCSLLSTSSEEQGESQYLFNAFTQFFVKCQV